GLGAAGHAGGKAPRYADEARQIKLLFERAAIVLGGDVDLVSPAQDLTIGREADGRDRLALAGQPRQDLASWDLPEHDGFVIAASTRYPASARMKGGGDHQIIMAGEGVLDLPGRIGQERDLVGARGKIIAG